MKIFIDEKEANEKYKFLPLPDLLENIKSDLDNKIIYKVLVNGKELTEKDLSDSFIKKDNINVIKFITKDTEVLIDETLEEIQKYLPKLKDGVLEIAESFRVGESEEPNKKYQQVIEGINWYIDIILKILSLTNFDDSMDKLDNILDEFNKILKEMMDAYSNKDMVLVADILEYEIYDYLSKFIEINEKIIMKQTENV